MGALCNWLAARSPSLSVFVKQRSRWTQGNFYVTRKYLPVALRTPFPIGIEILNNIMCYILLYPLYSGVISL